MYPYHAKSNSLSRFRMGCGLLQYCIYLRTVSDYCTSKICVFDYDLDSFLAVITDHMVEQILRDRTRYVLLDHFNYQKY